MQEKWNEILKPGTIVEIRLQTDPEIITTYFVLEARQETSFMDDGPRYECLVLNQKGEVHFCQLHENELHGQHYYFSRKVKFYR